MSGVEILGIIASAGQVALYGLQFIAFLSKIPEKIKDSPGEIEQHLGDIQQLLGITEDIQQTTYPQNPIVLTNLDYIHCQAKHLATVLDNILRKHSKTSIKAYWQILRGREEKQISAIFDNLEKAKSALTLYIVSSNKDSLHDTNISLARLEKAISGMPGTTRQSQGVANNSSGRQRPQGGIVRAPAVLLFILTQR